MTKKLIVLFLLIMVFSNVIFSKEKKKPALRFDFSMSSQLSESKNILSFVNGVDVFYISNIKNKKSTYFIKSKKSDKGEMIFIGYDGDSKIDEIWDYWFGLTYLNDSILDIKDRLDMKIGLGCYLIKEEKTLTERKTKISYGLILRNQHLLHSFRFKDYFKFNFLDIVSSDYKLIINYELPNGNKHFEKLSIELTPGVKLFNFSPAISWRYDKTFKNDNLETVIKFGVEL